MRVGEGNNQVILSNVLETIEAGSRPRGGVNDETGTIPSIGGENITADGRTHFRSVRKIPDSFFRAMPRGHLRPLDVLINKDGAQTGKVAIYQGDFPIAAINEHVFLLRGNPTVLDQGYLYYHLLWEATQRQIARVITGSAQPGINSQFTDAITVRLPSIQEQRRIADILDTADAAIQQTEALITKLKQVKAGLLHDLLTRGLDERGQLRDPIAHPEQFKDSSLGCIPQGWEAVELGSHALLITSGSRGWAAYYAEDGALFLRIGNLTREHLNLRLTDLVHVRPPQSGEGSRTAIRSGDLLISITADLGIIGVIPAEFGEAYVNQHIALVRLDPTRANARWAGNYLAGSAGQKQFYRLNDAGAKAGLNLPTVSKLLVALPCIHEQERIVSVIDAHDTRIRAEEAYRDKLKLQKQGLMHDLLTGRVRVDAAEKVTA